MKKKKINGINCDVLLFLVQFDSESSAVPQSASRIADNCSSIESIVQTKCTPGRIRFRSNCDNDHIAPT